MTLPQNLPYASDEDHKVLSILRQGVMAIDGQNTVNAIYAHTESILGRSRESLIFTSLGEISGIGSAAQDLVNRARADNTPLNSYDVRCQPALGDIELVDLHANPLEEEGLVILSVLPRRITAFLEKKNEMDAAARSVSGLASMLAHEVKNPLSGIRGAAQLMGRALDDKHIQLTELICKEVDRIKDLVDDLENFNAPVEQNIEPVNIHEVLDHVLNVAVAGFASEATVRPKFDPSLPPVAGNYDRLVQVFLNLVKNAVEAAGKKADITVTTAYRHGIWIRGAEGDRKRLPVEIAVIDNGPGIPEAIKGHLFDPFVTGRSGGTGLGLSMVARYVSSFGGTVTADNLPDGGAVFKIQLGLYEDRHNEQQ